MGELDKIVCVFKKYGVGCVEDIFQVDMITEEALNILSDIFSIVEPSGLVDDETSYWWRKCVLIDCDYLKDIRSRGGVELYCSCEDEICATCIPTPKDIKATKNSTKTSGRKVVDDALVIKVTHCRDCKGKGQVDRDRGKHIDDCDPIKTVWVECPDCHGTGHIVDVK